MSVFEKPWDYVIIGGGTAGCVLANRLSEDARVSVLLLEAGGSGRDLRVEIPLLIGHVIGNPRFDWMWKSAPEPHLNDRVMPLPRGRMLGGSSGMNGMVYVRGHRIDYDGWADLGCKGWGWSDVLPYFMRSELAEGPPMQGHGTTGPWINSDPGMRWPALDAYIDAAEQAGIPRTQDYNSGENEGVAYFRATIHRGRRQSTAKAFLGPATNRSNLTVVTQAHVNRLVVEGRHVMAVDLVHKGQRHSVRPKQEIVLSAGAYASPAILERSGIGQAARLAKLGITPVLDLPGVGENLQDHWQIRVQHRLQGTPTLNDAGRSLIGRASMAAQWALFRSGPMSAQPPLLAAFASVTEGAAAPDVQIHVSAASYDQVGGPLHAWPGITSSACILRPVARGHVHVTDADPAKQPEILNNFLGHPDDVALAVRAVGLVRRIMAQPAMARFDPEETSPGANIQDRDALIAYARRVVATVFHPVGTCRMGQGPDAVVCPELKLAGLTGLRIVDASVMPTIPSGNTAAPVVMIAEKAADLMRAARLADAA